MSLTEQFRTYIQTQRLFQKKDRLLLAVSGGVDSVALCALCQAVGYNFAIAHCNFQLRGKESDADEEFVQQLALHYKVDFFVKRFDTEDNAADNSVSIQVAARELRYAWFESLMYEEEKAGDYLLTAHHADDNMETMLMNYFKGTGMNGIRGILPRQGRIIRPLLFASKKSLEEYAAGNQLKFREDESNSSDKYTRNYFRNQLIPGIEKVFPAVRENLYANAERFRDIHILYQMATETLIKKLVTVKGKEIHIPVLKLLKTPAMATLLFEICKQYGFTASQNGEMLKLLHSSSGKYIQSVTYRALINRNWLVISPKEPLHTEHILIENIEKEIQFVAGSVHIDISENLQINPDNVLIVKTDASKIRFPLLLRRWKKGDYFYPLGMQKKKKLSRFFIDQKLSLFEKEQVWVLESDKKIIWVVGYRIDDRFKITGQTKNVLQFSFLKN